VAPLTSEDGVRPAIRSVYIDSDVLLNASSDTSRRRKCSGGLSLSSIRGAQGLPNSAQPFFQAREDAAQRRLWLVVNLQHPATESSEKLNCDVWGSAAFRDEIFGKQAVLWQRDVSHYQAEQYIVYYFDGRTPSVEECPIVMLVDPRTGRALRRWRAGSDDFALESDQAFQQITEFFEMHTLEGFMPPESPQATPKATPVHKPADDPVSDDFCMGIVEGRLDELTDPALSEPICTKTTESSEETMSSLPSVARVVTPQTEGAVCIVFRFPNGTRCERAFASDEPIAHVLEAAADGFSTDQDRDAASRTEMLFEVSMPLQPDLQLNKMPADTLVGSLDLHRKVLNVRLKRQVK
jgi:hypothetical protein